MSDDDLRGLLSALLDGELDPAEEHEVRALLDRSADARAELEDLSRVRRLVRDLAEVEPPAGFFEHLTLDSPDSLDSPDPAASGVKTDLGAARRARAHRERRRTWPKVAAAVLAAAAAIVLLLGLTPVTDTVVPPVQAYADRHLAMTGPNPDGTTNPGTSTLSAFTPVSPTELDQAGAPAEVGAGYDRMGGYHTADGVMHVMYEQPSDPDPAHVVSVYVQRGHVSWDALPKAGRMAPVGADQAWQMDGPDEDVVVVERGTMVYTVIAADSHDGMMDVLHALPPPPAPSVVERVRQACRSIIERVGLAD